MNDLIKVLTRSTPLQLLLLNLMAFSLGAGIAHYFGSPLPLPVYAVGQSISLALMYTAIYLREYFASFTQSTIYPPPMDRATQLTRKALQSGLLITALGFATLATTLVIIASRMAVITPLTIVLLITGIIGVVLIVIPSIRMMESGAGEVILAFLLVLITPALAYSLAATEIHRYLLLISLALTFMLVTTQIISQFSTYAADIQACRTNLLIRLGWQRTWHLHHVLLILAAVTLITAGIQGLPWSVLLPVAVTIPLAIWQVFLLSGMAAGKKPQWQIMRAISLAIPGLTLYFITFMFWVK